MADSPLDLLHLNDVVVTCQTNLPVNATVQNTSSLAVKVLTDGGILLTTEVKPTLCFHPIQGVQWNFGDLDPVPTECMSLTLQIVAASGSSHEKEVVLIELGLLQTSDCDPGPYASSVVSERFTDARFSISFNLYHPNSNFSDCIRIHANPGQVFKPATMSKDTDLGVRLDNIFGHKLPKEIQSLLRRMLGDNTNTKHGVHRDTAFLDVARVAYHFSVKDFDAAADALAAVINDLGPLVDKEVHEGLRTFLAHLPFCTTTGGGIAKGNPTAILDMGNNPALRMVEMMEDSTICKAPLHFTDQEIEFLNKSWSDLLAGVVPVQPGSDPSDHPIGILLMAKDILTYINDPSKQHTTNDVMPCSFAAMIGRHFQLPKTLNAYEFIMKKLVWLMPLTSLLQDQYSVILGAWASDAVSFALEYEEYDFALTWINQLRSTTWGIYYHARSFQGLVTSTDLESLKARLARLPHSASENERRQIYYAETLTKLEILIKRLPVSITPKTPVQIQEAVNLLGGPIVFFNINRYSCDALALIPDDAGIIHIPLPNINYKKLKSMQRTFLRFLNGREEESNRNLDRVGKMVRPPAQAPRQHVSLPEVLGFLWTNIVQLILDDLAIQPQEYVKAEDLPRIWWCPSGPLSFLPLHAAGLYENGSMDNISNYAVSSYISDASSIFRAIIGDFTQPTNDFQMLAVAHPAGCGLPGTMKELKVIRQHTRHHPLITLTDNEATPLAVERAMNASSWVHFACHGIQHPHEPTKSALILANRARLNILDLGTMCLRLPNAEFAFLSACQTAKGHINTPDEFIHLAGGMMAAGYRSVIATMWSISDSTAPFIADVVYQRLFEGGRPDYRQAACALHDAVKKLRTEMGGSYMDWVPFLHMGV